MRGRRAGRRFTMVVLAVAALLVFILLTAFPLFRRAKGFSREAFWNVDEKKGQEMIRGVGRWLVECLWRQGNPGKKISSSGDRKNKGGDPDPAFEQFQAVKTFYQEHQYLSWYGDEETGEDNVQVAQEILQVPLPIQAEAVGLGNTARLVTGSTYVLEQLADYDFLMKHFYSVHTSTTAGRDLMDAGRMLGKDFSIGKEGEGYQILIYHTHSQETFADSGPGQTVTGLGTYLTELLTERGYRVYHDTSVYDLVDGKLDRSRAYTYAGEGISRILEENPSIQVVLDLHRDGVSEKLHLVTEVDGKPTAQIMFFNGLSRTPEGEVESLENPYLEDNLAFSFQLELAAQAYFPGFTRKIYLKGLRYNLHMRPRSLLVEAGAQTNTYEEALNAMEPLAELLDLVLQQ